MNPAPPVMTRVAISNGGAFRVLQCEPQLFGERVDGRPASLPCALGFEPHVADAAAPRGDGAADGPEIRSLGVVLIQPANDVGRHAYERPQRRGGLDAVLAAVP